MSRWESQCVVVKCSTKQDVHISCSPHGPADKIEGPLDSQISGHLETLPTPPLCRLPCPICQNPFIISFLIRLKLFVNFLLIFLLPLKSDPNKSSYLLYFFSFIFTLGPLITDSVYFN